MWRYNINEESFWNIFWVGNHYISPNITSSVEEFLLYFSICISLSRTREIQQDGKGPSCLDHSGPSVSLCLAVGCRFTPFTINFSDIIYWWHRTPELCLPSLMVANHNSSKKSTNTNWLKSHFLLPDPCHSVVSGTSAHRNGSNGLQEKSKQINSCINWLSTGKENSYFGRLITAG